MRILIVAESFLPHMNGVTNSVLRIADQLAARGDELEIIAPQQPRATTRLRTACGTSVAVRRVPSVPLAGYPDVRIAATSAVTLRRRIAAFRPDVIHLASPTVLGGRAMVAAQKQRVPAVAVFQTDLAGYTARYGMPFLEAATWQLLRDVHNRAALTLAPSSATAEQLASHGIERVHRWGRGVDTSRFSADLADRSLRARYAAEDERLVVYAGRLAAEKQVEDLRALHDLPGTRLLIIGDGPERESLERLLPRASFTGFLSGSTLAAHMASADLFVHPGELETFGQTIQEAMASGLPVIAPAAGGPLDLVSPSRTGWLYAPGDLAAMRAHAVDLLFDDAKRAAFSAAALEAVKRRTWPVLTEQLRGYYEMALAASPVRR